MLAKYSRNQLVMTIIRISYLPGYMKQLRVTNHRQLPHILWAFAFLLTFACLTTTLLADIEQITSDTSELNYSQRLTLVRNLSPSLSKEQVGTLMGFLESNKPLDGISDDELATIKNDVFDHLIKMRDFPSGLLDLTLAMIKNKKNTVVWRDYGIQKLPDIYMVTSNKEHRDRIQQALPTLAHETTGTFAGTALLGMHQLTPAVFTPTATADSAIHILDSSSVIEANQVTALQILANYQPGEAHNRAKFILTDPESTTGVMLKTSALATLGKIGSRDDLTIVEKYVRSYEYRLKRAATAAENKILVRLTSNS